MRLADIGVNLTSSQFVKDKEDVIQAALQVGVEMMVITGTNEFESQQAAELAQAHSGLYSTAGVHPHDAKDASPQFVEHIETLYRQEQVVAIGECGLDFNRDFSPRPVQEAVFEQQIALAQTLQAPLFMHQRDAHQRFIDIIKPYHNIKQAVVHCFTGNEQELFDYLDLGFYIGITGWVCDERRGLDVLELTKSIPADRLLIETDSPYLLPRNLTPKPKSRRNQPKYLPHILQTIAIARGDNAAELAKQIWHNSTRFFQLDFA